MFRSWTTFQQKYVTSKKINRDHKLCGQQLAQTFSYAWFIFQNVTLWKLVKRLEIDAKARAWVFLCYALFKSTTRAINLLTVRRVDVMFGLAHVSHKYVIDDYSFSNALSRALRIYWWVPRYTHTPTEQNQIEISKCIQARNLSLNMNLKTFCNCFCGRGAA